MINVLKKNMFFLNVVVAMLMLIFVFLRLHNAGIINLHLEKRNKNVRIQKVLPTMTTPLKVPWRYHIEEDGFVFPNTDSREKYITYERVNGSWIKQLLQFENAVVFAHLLRRTLLIPPLFSHYVSSVTTNNQADTFQPFHFMSEIIDFDLLSSQLKLGEVNMLQFTKIQSMKKYDVCHDPRLGIWLDYIPSVENIQTWRLLKEQYFSPLKLNMMNKDETQYVCPGTEHYLDRWGPPLTLKALYRGILTELYNRDEDLIYFIGDTLDTKHIRFFGKQRTKEAQELLLFYIRFSNAITRQTKQLAKLLGRSYVAILANHIHGKVNNIPKFLENELLRVSNNGSSKTILIVSNPSNRYLFDSLKFRGFNLIYAEPFIQDNLLLLNQKTEVITRDRKHLLSLLLCAYASSFIGLPGTRDLYFVEHLRLQDTKMLDGLVTDKVSVRWAKHTIRDKADERKVLIRSTSNSKTQPASNQTFKLISTNLTQGSSRSSTTFSKKILFIKPKKKLDRLNSIACIFCNYVRYVTGHHGCPSMKHLC